MFKNQYYYFVAGLPDFSFDSTKLPFTVSEFKEILYEELKPYDKQLIDKYFLEADKENLLKLLLDKDAELKNSGVFSREDILSTINSLKDEVGVKNTNMPDFFEVFIKQWLKEDAEAENKNWENILTSLYMDYGTEVKNTLVSQWFTLNLNIGNILAAIYSRKYELDVKEVIVGNNSIAQTIRANTNSRDFGLVQELDYFDAILRISEETDIYERERKIDKFRWDWLDENTVFDYFNIEYIFAYLCKLQILERWVQLNAEEGERVFRELIANMKKDVQVPDEE